MSPSARKLHLQTPPTVTKTTHPSIKKWDVSHYRTSHVAKALLSIGFQNLPQGSHLGVYPTARPTPLSTPPNEATYQAASRTLIDAQVKHGGKAEAGEDGGHVLAVVARVGDKSAPARSGFGKACAGLF